jgi:hypothetical protein
MWLSLHHVRSLLALRHHLSDQTCPSNMSKYSFLGSPKTTPHTRAWWKFSFILLLKFQLYVVSWPFQSHSCIQLNIYCTFNSVSQPHFEFLRSWEGISFHNFTKHFCSLLQNLISYCWNYIPFLFHAFEATCIVCMSWPFQIKLEFNSMSIAPHNQLQKLFLNSFLSQEVYILCCKF